MQVESISGKTDFLRKLSVHCVLIAITGIIIYSNTFNVPFHFDDATNIIENPIIKDLKYFAEPSKAKAFPLYDTFKNRFIGYLAFALNYKARGLDVTGYHVVNLAIHIINTLLVYWLVVLTLKLQVGATLSGDPHRVSRFKLQDSLSTVNGQQSMNLIALFSALIFVSHPVQTQAVTYIVQRFTSLAVLFYLLSLVLYVKFRFQVASRSDPQRRPAPGCKLQDTPLYPPLTRGELKGGENSKPCLPCLPDRQAAGRLLTLNSTLWYLGSVFSAVLAMKTKEIAFTLPIIIVLYEFNFFTETFNLPKNRQAGFKLLTFNFKRFLYLLPFLLTLLIIPLSYIGADTSAGNLLGDVSEATRLQTTMSRPDYLFTEFRVIVTYIRLLFLPVNQNLDYDYPVYSSFLNPNVFLSFVFLLSVFGLGVYLFYCSRQQHSQAKTCGYLQLETRCGSPLRVAPTCNLKLISFGILWFFITLSVESSVIPIEDVIFEHRVYLPGIGLIIAVVSFVFYAFSRLTFRLSLTACYLLLTTSVILLSIAAYQRNAVWKDEMSLWTDVVNKSPEKARPYCNLAVAYNNKNQLYKVIEYYSKAIAIKPDYAYAYNNRGNTYVNIGLYDKALADFTMAVSIKPDFAAAYNNRGIFYSKIGMYDKSVADYSKAIAIKPDFAEAYTNRGNAFDAEGETNKAIEDYNKALTINPGYGDAYYNRGITYMRTGLLSNAENDFLNACRLGSRAGCTALNSGLFKSQQKPD